MDKRAYLFWSGFTASEDEIEKALNRITLRPGPRNASLGRAGRLELISALVRKGALRKI